MKKKQGFIERFDGDWAIIHQADRSTIRVRRNALPPEAKEGCFVVETDGPVHFCIDHVITEKRKQELRRLTDSYHE